MLQSVLNLLTAYLSETWNEPPTHIRSHIFVSPLVDISRPPPVFVPDVFFLGSDSLHQLR